MQASIYQSPINLCDKNAIDIDQIIKLIGKNTGTTFDKNTKNFYVDANNKITLKIDNKKFLLHEYHFHVPGEHKINNKTFQAEVHFVFVEHGLPSVEHSLPSVEQTSNNCHKKYDVCGGCQMHENDNLVVIGRVINNDDKIVNLKKLQPRVPSVFYEYDGGLTTGDTSTPVRWIVGQKPQHYSIKQIIPIAKGSREIQPLNGRIILKSGKNHN